MSKLALILICLVAKIAVAAPDPPSGLQVTDVPDDNGMALRIRWEPSPADVAGADPLQITGYVLKRATNQQPFETVAKIPAGTKEFLDQKCKPKQTYVYALTAVAAEGQESTEVTSEPTAPIINWFNRKKMPLLGCVVLVCGGLLISTELARRGKPVYIRSIAGLTAIEEAVGRATEMGRPMVFVPGIMDLNEIQTVAGVTVLSHVAQTAAQYDMALDVPTSKSLVMTASRDAVQAGCLKAHRPEVYDPERIYYVTDDQFSYVAHVCGRMLREKPAACFYIGQFYAESLLLAETGNSIGAIQIAGTAEASQMPFFVAACDYALLGEEMFAASAYLSREPEQLGMLRGQDWAKLVAGSLIVGGSSYLTFSIAGQKLVEWLTHIGT